MAKSSNRWLVLLLCLNAVLVTCLVACYVEMPRAHAQVRANDYMVVPGDIREDKQAVWVLDMATFQLTSCVYDRNAKRVKVGEVLDLNAVFR